MQAPPSTGVMVTERLLWALFPISLSSLPHACSLRHHSERLCTLKSLSQDEDWGPEFPFCSLHLLPSLGASLVAQWPRIHPPVQETWVPSLGQEDPLGKEMATHSSILAWSIPWTEEPGGLQSMGSQKSRTWLSIDIHTVSTLMLFLLCFAPEPRVSSGRRWADGWVALPSSWWPSQRLPFLLWTSALSATVSSRWFWEPFKNILITVIIFQHKAKHAF